MNMKIDPQDLTISRGPIFTPKKHESSKNKPRDIKQVDMIDGKFLRGPIPLIWLQSAAQLPGKSIHVAIAVYFLAGLKNNKTVKLTQTLLNEFGVKRNSKYRALEELAKVGLIEFTKTNGKNPIVTILAIRGDK